MNCAVPFADAFVSHAENPDYPVQLRNAGVPASVTVVEVGVSATGTIDDAWIYVPSGYAQFDGAALLSAKNSTYHPARSFCQDVPGQYLFRAEFSPN
jgi:TonB family protein